MRPKNFYFVIFCNYWFLFLICYNFIKFLWFSFTVYTKHCTFDQGKYHTVLALALGYYDEDDDKATMPRVRIDFNEFAKIIK
ncbi:MAG: hypothetical protein SPLM_04180 [Spiroplasma phoeniceum]|uniref:hypothetical protein n=1 Tax=Spiroplasma phoeniceum TaxID=47835 RepID=UPI0032947075